MAAEYTLADHLIAVGAAGRHAAVGAEVDGAQVDAAPTPPPPCPYEVGHDLELLDLPREADLRLLDIPADHRGQRAHRRWPRRPVVAPDGSGAAVVVERRAHIGRT